MSRAKTGSRRGGDPEDGELRPQFGDASAQVRELGERVTGGLGLGHAVLLPRCDARARRRSSSDWGDGDEVVAGDRLAKAVVIEDQSRFLVAVIPSTHRLELGALHERLGDQVGLATEAEVRLLFDDCDDGAVPGLAQAYGLDVLVDDALLAQDDVYFEAGTHADLIHMTGAMFRDLMSTAEHGEFSRHV